MKLFKDDIVTVNFFGAIIQAKVVVVFKGTDIENTSVKLEHLESGGRFIVPLARIRKEEKIG